MTRILYWNIRNFGLKTIQAMHGEDPERPVARLQHIIDVLTGATLGGESFPPDIFVLVEGHERTQDVHTEGSIAPSGDPTSKGLLDLLGKIRALLGSAWCLVPAAFVGNFGFREAVGVYYNAKALEFVGPWVHYLPNTYNAEPVASPLDVAKAKGTIVDYPPEWKQCLPSPDSKTADLRELAVRSEKQDAPEWRMAGRITYQIPGWPRVMKFPDADNRQPYMTTFRDTSNNRLIRLFSVHTSPKSADAATKKFATVPEVEEFPDGSVTVVIGDFNVDPFENPAPFLDWPAGYEMVLDPRSGGQRIEARKPYCMTHLLPPEEATPFKAKVGTVADPQHNVYPRYGYMGAMKPGQNEGDDWKVTDNGAIDNAFVRYGKNCYGAPGIGGVQRRTTIVNTVTGTPYTELAPPPAGVTAELTSGYEYGSSLDPKIPPGGIDPPIDTIGFGTWSNFGKIHGTSDHLALSIDV